MAPESNSPEPSVPTQEKTNFEAGEHPTDLVRPFGQGELADVHDELQKRGVPDHIPIHPVTLEVPVDKIPLNPTEEKKPAAWKKWVAGILGGTVLTGTGAGVGMALSDREPSAPTEASPEPAASAPVVPGEAAPETAEATPSEEVPSTPETESISLDRISGTPTPEQIEAARTQPVTVAEFPTALEAVVQFGNLSNVYAKSGLTEWQGDTLTFTPETETIGTDILANMYGPNLNDDIISRHRQFRLDWSLAIHVAPGPELMVYYEPDPATLTENANGQYTVELNEIHEDSAPNNANRGQDFRGTATVEQVGDRWYLVSRDVLHEIDYPS